MWFRDVCWAFLGRGTRWVSLSIDRRCFGRLDGEASNFLLLLEEDFLDRPRTTLWDPSKSMSRVPYDVGRFES